MATFGGGRFQLYQHNGNVWTLFALRKFITTPATNGGAFGTRILIAARDTLIVSDECSAFQATQGTIFSFTNRIIPGAPQKHYRISAL